MKKILLFLLINFISFSVSALSYGSCDYSEISRMKFIVSNVNLSFSYKIEDGIAFFDVTINNLINDIYFYDVSTQKTYYYSDTNNGEITIYNYIINSGKYKFYSAKNECFGIFLGEKYYKFPTYNKYYDDPLCSDVPNYSLCKKWAQVNYSQEEFEKKIFEYKNSTFEEEEKEIQVEHQKGFFEKIVNIYINYYYYFLIGLILICFIILIINNRKNRFDL